MQRKLDSAVVGLKKATLKGWSFLPAFTAVRTSKHLTPSNETTKYLSCRRPVIRYVQEEKVEVGRGTYLGRKVMFEPKVLIALGAAGVLLWFAIVFLEKERAWIYGRLAPFMLIHSETLRDSRIELARIKRWLDGRTFRELHGEVFSIMCMYGLLEGPHNNPDLIRIVEIISKYGTVPQKAVFVRAVLRDVAKTSPRYTSEFLDLLDRHGFKLSPVKRSRVELEAAQLRSRQVDNPNQMDKKLRNLLRRTSLKKAFKAAQESQLLRKESPRKGLGKSSSDSP